MADKKAAPKKNKFYAHVFESDMQYLTSFEGPSQDNVDKRAVQYCKDRENDQQYIVLHGLGLYVEVIEEEPVEPEYTVETSPFNPRIHDHGLDI